MTQVIECGEVRADIDLEVTTQSIHALSIAIGDRELLPNLNDDFQLSDDEVPPEKAYKAFLSLILDGIKMVSGEESEA
jgi:hypothetical protein